MAFGIYLTFCMRFIFAIYFFSLCNADPNSQINEKRPQKWISEIMSEAEMKFDMVNNLVSEKCRNDFEIYNQHLSNQTIWAVRFLESSEWPKLSIFSGLTYHYGNFEECLKAQGPNIQGRYCLANIKYDFNFDDNDKAEHVWKINPPENESAWKYVKRYELELTRLSRQSLTWALCIPSSCSWHDLNRTLDRLIIPIFEKYGLDAKTSVLPEYCQMRNEDNPPYYFHLIRYSFYVYLSIIIIATLYDAYSFYSNDHEDNELISNLSLIKIYQRLTRVDEGSPYHYANFFKILLTIGAILTHNKFISIAFPTFQIEEMETSNTFIYRFSISHFIDLLFFFSGISFSFNQKWMEIPLNTFMNNLGSKWISTSLILLIGCIFHQYVIRFMGRSPIQNIEGLFLDSKTNSWLSTIFLVYNLMPKYIQSLPTSWTIYVHFQIYLICGIFFIVFRQKYRIWSLLGALYTMSIMYTFMITLGLSNYGPLVVSPRITTQMNYWEMTWYPDGPFFYVNPIHRIQAFVIGCATVLIMKNDTKKNNTNLSMNRIILGGAALYLFTWGPLLYFIYVTSDNYNGTVLGKAIFNSLKSTLFLIPAVYTAYFISNFNIINSIKNLIKLRPIVALARLSRALCTASFTYQVYMERRRKRIPSDNSALDIFEKAIADVVMSIIISVFWYLIIEGPVVNFVDTLMKKLNSKPKM